MSTPLLPDVSADFQAGAAVGYQDCELELRLGPDTSDELRIDTDKHSPDWYAGWLAGYRAFMESRYGQPADPSRLA